MTKTTKERCTTQAEVSIRTSPETQKRRLWPAGFPAGHRRRLMVACSFLSVRKSSSPSCFQKSPERRFCISGNVISESRSLFLENLTLFFDFSLFCCRICEKATQKCGFFSCISIVNTGWHARRDSNPQPSEPESVLSTAKAVVQHQKMSCYYIFAVFFPMSAFSVHAFSMVECRTS